MAQSNDELGRTRGPLWIAVIAVAALVIMLVVWKSGAAAKKMSSAIASDKQQLSGVRVGDTAKFVVEVSDSKPNGTLTGIVLKKKTEDVYTKTPERTTVHWDNQTKIVMGKSDDLNPGAVVHITAIAREDHTFSAQQLVVLTGYVKVQSQ